MQDMLSETPLIPFEKMTKFDDRLVKWWESLPRALSTELEENIPQVLHVPRQIMRWRYQIHRVLLYRPYVLSSGLQRRPYQDLGAEEKKAVHQCRLSAAEAIDDIVKTSKEDMMSAFNGVVSITHSSIQTYHLLTYFF